ncbi:MAG TPA: hypothetical protein VLX29_11490 [Nitrospirota bacterium]|nr:hypothetical protein [Nitrospirota bacterium]
MDKKSDTCGIKNTVSLDIVEILENWIPYAEANKHLEVIGAPFRLLLFNFTGNLI